MPPYQYIRLSTEAQDIRLLTLLPGKFDDTIRFTLSHAPLVHQIKLPLGRMFLKELRETLPLGWKAFETRERRFIFVCDETAEASWSHPDPEFDCTCLDHTYEGLYMAFLLRTKLSYTWCSTEILQTAYVENSTSPISKVNTPTTLQVSQNLALALRYLRHTLESRRLWIDALCSNQKDDTERMEQVKRRANIYKLAYQALVWLGPETNTTAAALSTLRYLGAQ
ncbi:hypothetical protein V493_03841 [Pseudogymnoascus sp. VKM F-4281 (FW-2241)]|nr:hypothetical protein V493_03841 [Pseudogymnoascus sp. VKM F-4281 (FW-2241)]